MMKMLQLAAPFIFAAVVASPGICNFKNIVQFTDTHGTDIVRLKPPAGKIFGTSIAGAADLNGDGVPDVVVTVESDKGHAAQYSGFNGAFIMMQDDLSFFGPIFAAFTQLSIATIGDFNNDAIQDFVMGVPEQEDFLGDIPAQIIVYSGAGGKLLHLQFTFAPSTGIAVSDIGDVNADGKDDILFSGDTNGSSPFWSNSVRLGLSPVGNIKYTIFGTNVSDGFGNALAGIGDINFDGIPDFVAGARFANYARVVSGRNGTTIYTLTGGVSFGQSVAFAGDHNGDGMNDILVGGPGESATGSVSIYSGANGLLLNKVFGQTAGEDFGLGLSSVGDLDQDGFDEFAVGAPKFSNTSFVNAGAVRLFEGSTAAHITTILGDGNESRLGTALSRAGDVNADGLPDLLALSPGGENLPGQQPAGHVRILSFAPGLEQFDNALGTPGCSGIEHINLKSFPSLTINPMIVTSSSSPPASLGLLFITDAANLGGFDPFGLGIVMYPDLINATESYFGDIVSDATGFGIGLVPVVNNPQFLGVDFYFQTLWYWGSGPCVPSASLLSSSQLLRLTF
ncbi:MAG: integrin alpha [Planctomycetota bacterium]